MDRSRDQPPTRLTTSDRATVATEIAEALAEQSVVVDEGGSTWVTRVDGRTVSIGPGLYGGTSGVALFLAAWAHCDAGVGAREIADRAWAPLRRSAAAWRRRGTVRTAPLGLGRGVSSVAYAMAVAGDLLDDDGMVGEAVRLFSAVPVVSIDTEDRFDVLGGLAGALLCGSALETLGRRRGLDVGACSALADRAARRLCAQAIPLPELVGPDGEPAVGWAPRPGARIVSGMAHGTAGIVMALSRWAVRGTTEVDATVRAGLAMERATFARHLGNWLDRRVDHERAMTMWCHGGPGIALARLAMLGPSDDRHVIDEIEAGLAVAVSAPLDEGADHLCCGHLGRAELLFAAGRRFDRPAAIRQATERLDLVATRWRTGRAHLGAGDTGPRSDPGFFLGLAGLGSGLLRRHHPARLPSIGAFEVAAPV
ncbi:MAG: lanthionine synthetase LanC family protein, partial [Acidobacteriota bacterium]